MWYCEVIALSGSTQGQPLTMKYNLVDLTIDLVDRSELMKLLISINMLAISIIDLFGWELVSFAWDVSTKSAPKIVAP